MKDWGEVSEIYEEIHKTAFNKELANESEAQTRFDVIDRIIKEVLQWGHGQISVEQPTDGNRKGFIDYILMSGDNKIIIEAKKTGATFPSPTSRRKLKLTGSVLGNGEIKEALIQAEEYAWNENANIVSVTNGHCWCFYPLVNGVPRDSIYATILSPFEKIEDAEYLFQVFASHNVENDSLTNLDILPPPVNPYKKLYYILPDADAKTT